jgi:hypothetical protein
VPTIATIHAANTLPPPTRNLPSLRNLFSRNCAFTSSINDDIADRVTLMPYTTRRQISQTNQKPKMQLEFNEKRFKTHVKG